MKTFKPASGPKAKAKAQLRALIKRLQVRITHPWPSVITAITENVITDIASTAIARNKNPLKIHPLGAQV